MYLCDEHAKEVSLSRDNFLIVCRSLAINQDQMLAGTNLQSWAGTLRRHGAVVLWLGTRGFMPTFTKR